eukprot:SAG31_NODE_3621_length_4059_cov_7.360101_2_plen_442_part_00
MHRIDPITNALCSETIPDLQDLEAAASGYGGYGYASIFGRRRGQAIANIQDPEADQKHSPEEIAFCAECVAVRMLQLGILLYRRPICVSRSAFFCQVYTPCFNAGDVHYVERGREDANGVACDAPASQAKNCGQQCSFAGALSNISCAVSAGRSQAEWLLFAGLRVGGWHSKAATHLEHEVGIQRASDVTICSVTPLGTQLLWTSMSATMIIYFALLCPCCCGVDTMRMVFALPCLVFQSHAGLSGCKSLSHTFACACCPVQYPRNIILLHLFSLCWGVCLGVVCATYTATSVLLAMAMCFGVTVALTLYAYYTKTDYTQHLMFMVGALAALICFGFVTWISAYISPSTFSVLNCLYALAGTVVFMIFLVIDTQMIAGGKHHKYTIATDEYGVYFPLCLNLQQCCGMCSDDYCGVQHSSGSSGLVSGHNQPLPVHFAIAGK